MINLKSIYENQVPQGEHLIKTRIDEVVNFSCFAATNHITGTHIFILELNHKNEMPEIKTKKFRGVSLEIFDFEEEKKELHIFLLDNELKDIFFFFIEDIIESISTAITENEALIKISNIILKWKKLFEKYTNKALSLEKQKGLIGELLFLEILLNNGFDIEQLLTIWCGPEYEDKDFLYKNIGVEVKLSTSKLPKIQISNERQLDGLGMKYLFLSHIVLDEVKGAGFSLNDLIKRVGDRFSNNNSSTLNYIEKLTKVGYEIEDYDCYNNMYQLREINYYSVSTDFPKIIPMDLINGVYNVTYLVEPTAVNNFLISFEQLSEILNLWKEN